MSGWAFSISSSHVFAHVDPDHVVLRIEQVFGQGPRQLGLAHAGGPEEQEGADGTVRVLEPRPAALDGPHDRVDGLVLADDPGLEPLLHLEDAVALGLGDLVYRDAGHLGDDGGDVLGGHRVAAALLAGEVQPHHGPGLVHRVDGLVRQGLVGEIAVGEPDGGLHGLVRIGDVVELLVMGLQVAEDLDGLRHVRGLHDDLLEAAVQGAVLLHDLRELVHRGRGHALDLAAGEGGLEHVRRVQAARRAAGAHDGVELVDEQDQVGVRLGFLDDGLEALLEVAAVFGAGHHRSDVQRQDALLRQGGGNVPGGDPKGDALHNGRLAHAGLATMADLPTPGSPMSIGLFFLRRPRISITRAISMSRPTTGSSFPSRAAFVRSYPNSSMSMPFFLVVSPSSVSSSLSPSAGCCSCFWTCSRPSVSMKESMRP